MVVYPTMIVVAMLVVPAGAVYLPVWAVVTLETVLALVLTWTLMFFRDPHRQTPADDAVLVAPADGKVTDVETVDGNDLCSGPAMRIGIFLSIFNTHINRAPCQGRIETITYRPGKYLNALNPLSSKVNESNAVVMVRTNAPQERFMVRQISGAIARRIVCAAQEGQELARGERFGMIKFGSRTELYVPAGKHVKCMVRVGDAVKAGVTPLLRYEQ